MFELKVVKIINNIDDFFPKEKRMCAWLQASNSGAKVFVGEHTLAPFFSKLSKQVMPQISDLVIHTHLSYYFYKHLLLQFYLLIPLDLKSNSIAISSLIYTELEQFTIFFCGGSTVFDAIT